MSREEFDMIVTAHPANAAVPTVGPWTIVCSGCGPIGVATTTLAADGAITAHCHDHVGAPA